VTVDGVTLLWTRHGENHANLSRTLSHRVVDLDLTERGREQAHALADALAGPQLHGEVFTSPMRRARETTAIVANRLELRPVVIEELRELDVGSLDGRSDRTAWETYHATLAAWRGGRGDVRFPDGESLVELTERLRRGIERIAATEGSGPRLVVAHGANLRAALPLLAGVADPGRDLPLGEYATLAWDSAGIGLIDWPTPPPAT
jgi:broad specificity phosphatase PhoE